MKGLSYVKKSFFMREFPSSLEAMDEPRRSALQALLDGGWIEPDQVFYAQLCLEEALVNAIQHGNQGDPNRRVRLEMAAEGDDCYIWVTDEGGGFDGPPLEFPDCQAERGRGLALIRYCMTDVSYDKDQRRLEMRFTRNCMCSGDCGNDHG